MKKKSIIGLILIGVGIIGLFGLIANSSVALLFGSLTLLIVGAILVVPDIFKTKILNDTIKRLENDNKQLQNNLDSLCFSDYQEAIRKISELNSQIEQKKSEIDAIEQQRSEAQDEANEKIKHLTIETEKADKKLKTALSKLNRTKELYNSVIYSIDSFFEFTPELKSIKLPDNDTNDIEELCPSVILKLHYMDLKSLNKAFKDNDKQIETVLKRYQGRYTTKANQAIYDLMVVALRAELQNILYNLKYNKLEKGIEQVKNVTQKYLNVAITGNQSIAGTLTKFIGEIEYLFINAVKIEYNYYVKKEQARQEQQAIREQMKQEAEERKALLLEKEKIEHEENKYTNEIEKLKKQLSESADKENEALKAKILELQGKLSNVIVKKDSIIKLQNGKAGNVYIISNLGSFGDNVFKIGMTRRINPQDRVNELGDASVPFKFDVHSFIFSENAVELETKLHNLLNKQRVNKVNMRKEFFNISIDDLETLVNQIEPTAEFNKTMYAEEFRQSQSVEDVYSSDFVIDSADDE